MGGCWTRSSPAGRPPASAPEADVGRIVAVAGNLASGKSTLARALARHHGWEHYPPTGYDTTYLDDLFRDPSRWSFEAQMSFLDHKADAVRKAMDGEDTVVLDRSLAEDVRVFANYFHQRGWMSERSHRLYLRYASPLMDQLDDPAVVIYCYAPAEECEARLAARPRDYQMLFPSDHLRRLHDLYERWWPTVSALRTLRIDTTAIDARRPLDATQVAESIGDLLHAP